MKGRKSFWNLSTVSCTVCGVSVVIGMRQALRLVLVMPPGLPSSLTWFGTLMLLRSISSSACPLLRVVPSSVSLCLHSQKVVWFVTLKTACVLHFFELQSLLTNMPQIKLIVYIFFCILSLSVNSHIHSVLSSSLLPSPPASDQSWSPVLLTL